MANRTWPTGFSSLSALTALTKLLADDGSNGYVTGQMMLDYIIASYGGLRTKLTADTTFYVRTDGNDNNSGLANNAGGAWLTLQGAWDNLVKGYDLGGFKATVAIQPGTYEGFNTILGANALVGGYIKFDGGSTASVTITEQTSIVTNTCLWLGNPGPPCELTNCTIDGTGTFLTLYMQNPGVCWNIYNCNVVNAVGVTSIWIDNGATVQFFPKDFSASTIGLSSDCSIQFYTGSGGIISGYNTTFAFSGSPTFDYVFYLDPLSQSLLFYCTFTGTSSGQSYYIDGNSVLYSASLVGTFGSVAGATANGGQRVAI